MSRVTYRTLHFLDLSYGKVNYRICFNGRSGGENVPGSPGALQPAIPEIRPMCIAQSFLFLSAYNQDAVELRDTDTTHALTHWRRVTHICVGNLTIIGSDNGLSLGRRQAII